MAKKFSQATIKTVSEFADPATAYLMGVDMDVSPDAFKMVRSEVQKLIVAGSNKHVQFNSSGTLGGSADFTFDSTTKTLTTQKYQGGESSARSWTIGTRDSLTTIPVPYFRAATANTVTSLDIMPNGTASDFFGNGFAWIDVCDTDCATGEPAIKTARVGVTATYAEFGSKNFNGAAAHPVAITVAGGSRLLFGTSGLEIMQTASSKFGWGSADPADSVAAMDLVMSREGADHLGQSRAGNAQQWSLYNAKNSTNDYERFTIDWKTTPNVVRLGTQKGQSAGTARGIKIITDNTERIDIAATGAIRLNQAYTLPTTDGAYGQVLTTNGGGVVSWLTPAGGGGGGAAAGSNTQIQFNNAGAFGASANLTWNGTTLAVTGGITTTVNVNANAFVSTVGIILGTHDSGYLALGATSDTRLMRVAPSIFGIRNGSTGGGALEFTEISDPTGVADKARLYCRDNGSGKKQLCVIFGSGAVQVLATEP